MVQVAGQVQHQMAEGVARVQRLGPELLLIERLGGGANLLVQGFQFADQRCLRQGRYVDCHGCFSSSVGVSPSFSYATRLCSGNVNPSSPAEPASLESPPRRAQET